MSNSNNLAPGANPMTITQKRMSQIIDITRTHIDRDYLDVITDEQVSVVREAGKDVSTIRIFKLDKIVYDEEDYHLKIQSIIHSIYSIADTLFILITSSGNEVGFFIGVQSDKNVTVAADALEAGIKGIFPGSNIHNMNSSEIESILRTLKYPGNKKAGTVVGVSQVPSQWEREKKGEVGRRFSVQGMEHFIDGMKGKTYTGLIIANPLGPAEITALKTNLENLSTSLSVYAHFECQYGESEATTSQDTISQSVTDSVSDSLIKGVTYGTMQNTGTSKGNMPNVNTHLGFLGFGLGTQKGSFNSTGTQQTNMNQDSHTNTKGTQNGSSRMNGNTTGTNKSLSVTQENKAVVNLLKKVEAQITRLQESEVFGLWNCSAFFSAETPEIAIVAANMYKSLVCGDNNECEKAHISIWDSIRNANVPGIINSLSGLVIPSFRLKTNLVCKCGCLVNGSELPILMGLPRKSVSGVSVIKMASFGREVHYITPKEARSPQLIMGNVFHMGKSEDTPVGLSMESLAAHTFISGSSGVGKTTFTVGLLATLADNGVKFMVIEPEKGEYKKLLGDYPGIQVFTTNPLKHRMLKINPFAFNKKIHILSHIDRIMEVFSVCWPLYAAQPAMLREVIEEAYRRTGWDLTNSVYLYEGVVTFPDFSTLLEVLPDIIKKSKFVGESRGTYEGALLTRIIMLTNGLFGQIFNSKIGLSDEELFENNCIIDLSETGSGETNALVMGMMIIRLREYRMVKGIQSSGLKHVMLIEEAHNIFPSSSKKSVEGGENLSSKSVDMMTKCLAELRGYGQGFIIVDQRPSAVNDSCISNTSTKIFFRLPEREDQDAVSASLALSQEQSSELFRFPDQVALVYQENWIESVLTRVSQSSYRYKRENDSQNVIEYEILKMIRGYILGVLRSMENKGVYEISFIREAIMKMGVISEEKRKDFMCIFEFYDEIFKAGGSRFDSAKQRKEFYRSLCVEITQCGELMRHLDMSFIEKLAEEVGKNGEGPQKNRNFIEECQKIQKKAHGLIKSYVNSPNSEYKGFYDDIDWMIELLLLKPDDKRMYTIHNSLYGKVKER